MQYRIDKQMQDLGFRVIAERAHEPMALVEEGTIVLNRAARLLVALFKVTPAMLETFFRDLFQGQIQAQRKVGKLVTAHACLKIIVTDLPEGPHRFLIEVVRA